MSRVQDIIKCAQQTPNAVVRQELIQSYVPARDCRRSQASISSTEIARAVCPSSKGLCPTQHANNATSR